jgi:CheY-like chemotaxis protein
VTVRIRDSGVGIPPEMMPRIFAMFTQVDRSLERAQGGLGIGLTLVKRLVEMHGGGIEAHSEGPNRGSEFVVRLPVALDLKAEQPPAVNDGNATPHFSRRILVVDDNRDSADSLAMLLSILGNEVRTAHDGQEAVDLAAIFDPAVVFMDLGLPLLNGFDAAGRMREQPGGEKTVIVALTGWGQEFDRRRSQEAGFDYHFVKPVDPFALEKLLQELGTITSRS